MVLIFVDDEQSPIAIRTLYRICSHEEVSRAILDITHSRVHAMVLGAGLEPLEID